MLIIACAGGLGNQMFQYAFYLSRKNMNNDVKFDISWFNENKAHNGYELERIFSLNIAYTNEEDLYKIGKPKNIIDKIIKKIFYSNNIYYMTSHNEAINYLSDIVNYKSGYLFGYWQSEKYFEKIKNEVKKDFNFKIPLDIKNEEIATKMKCENSVAIHIRRGDYLKYDHLSYICTKNYYKNAIEYIEKYVSNPFYYIFSNDIEWCRKNLNFKNVTYVNWNIGKDSYKDMQLMSQCKHNIIANSSFSWWGAWLNNNPNKIVCVPEKWFDLPGCETRDICPDEWIRIKTK